MLNIVKEKNQDHLTIKLEGRLDTISAPQLEKELRQELSDIKHLVLDFSQLDYLSSAGLRVILSAQKVMNQQGEMIVRNVSDMIMEIFEVTGFSEILTIEGVDFERE